MSYPAYFRKDTEDHSCFYNIIDDHTITKIKVNADHYLSIGETTESEESVRGYDASTKEDHDAVVGDIGDVARAGGRPRIPHPH